MTDSMFVFNETMRYISQKRNMALKSVNENGETVKRSHGGVTGNITFDRFFTAKIKSNGFYGMSWKIDRNCETEEHCYNLYPDTVTSDAGLRKFGSKNRLMSLMCIPVGILKRLDLRHRDTYLVDIITSPTPRIVLRDRNKSDILEGDMSATIYCKAAGEIVDDVIIANSTEFQAYRRKADTIKTNHKIAHDAGKITIPFYCDIYVDPDDRHCDHVFSCKDGFLHNIPPELISHPSNLRFMDSYLNMSKGSDSWVSLDEFKEDIVASGHYTMGAIEDAIFYFDPNTV